MAYSNTRQVIRRHLYDQVPILGFNGTADSLSVTTVVDTFTMRDSNLPANHFKGTFVYRPGRTDDDRIKKAGALVNTTGTLSHTGTDYANTADNDYEIVGLLHPDDINNCIIRALRKVYYETQVPLTLVTDGDMSSSATSDWTGTNATLAKTVTAAQVFSGIRAMSVTATSALGQAQSSSILVTAGESVYASGIVRSSTGTARFAIYDVTNSSILCYIDSTQTNFQRLWLQCTVPSTCEQIALQLIEVANNDVGYWDSAFLYRLNDMRILAPSWVDEPWKLLKLREARYMKTINNSPTTGTGTAVGGGQQEAASRVLADWYTPRHFSLDPFHPEANPFAIQLQRTLPQNELWIEGKRPYFDIESLATESAATTAPLDLLLSYAKLELAKLLVKRYPQDPKWAHLLGESQRETESETMSRPEVPQQPMRYSTRGRI